MRYTIREVYCNVMCNVMCSAFIPQMGLANLYVLSSRATETFIIESAREHVFCRLYFLKVDASTGLVALLNQLTWLQLQLQSPLS